MIVYHYVPTGLKRTGLTCKNSHLMTNNTAAVIKTSQQRLHCHRDQENTFPSHATHQHPQEQHNFISLLLESLNCCSFRDK